MPTTRRGAKNSPVKSDVPDSPARHTRRGQVVVTPPSAARTRRGGKKDNTKSEDHVEKNAESNPKTSVEEEESPRRRGRRAVVEPAVQSPTKGRRSSPRGKKDVNTDAVTEDVQEATKSKAKEGQKSTYDGGVPENKEEIMNLAASVIVGQLKQKLGFKFGKIAKDANKSLSSNLDNTAEGSSGSVEGPNKEVEKHDAVPTKEVPKESDVSSQTDSVKMESTSNEGQKPDVKSDIKVRTTLMNPDKVSSENESNNEDVELANNKDTINPVIETKKDDSKTLPVDEPQEAKGTDTKENIQTVGDLKKCDSETVIVGDLQLPDTGGTVQAVIGNKKDESIASSAVTKCVVTKSVEEVEEKLPKQIAAVTTMFNPGDHDEEAIAKIATSLQENEAGTSNVSSAFLGLGPMDVVDKDPFSGLGITEEHIHQIQAVLSADEAKEILGDPSSFPGSQEHDSMNLSSNGNEGFDIEEAAKLLQVEEVKRYAPLEHSYVKATEPNPEETKKNQPTDSNVTPSTSKATAKMSNKDISEDFLSPRRSTRVIEAEQRAMAEKIRQENIEEERQALEKMKEEQVKKETQQSDVKDVVKPMEAKLASPVTEKPKKDKAKVVEHEKPAKEQKTKEPTRQRSREDKKVTPPSEPESKKKLASPTIPEGKKKSKMERKRSHSVTLPDEPILFTPDIPVGFKIKEEHKDEDEQQKGHERKSSVDQDVGKRRDSVGHDKSRRESTSHENKTKGEPPSLDKKERRESGAHDKKMERRESSSHKKEDKAVDEKKKQGKSNKSSSSDKDQPSSSQKNKDKEDETTKADDSDSELSEGLSYEDDEDDEDWDEEEDDPTKLWCICRLPHGDRFMICCDKCDEWYHGDCVEITKARGVAMEKNDEEWICPLCTEKEMKEKRKAEHIKSERMKEKLEKEELEERKREISLQAMKERKERRESKDHAHSKESAHSKGHGHSKERGHKEEHKSKDDKLAKPKLGEIRKKDHSKDSPDDAKKHKKRFKVFGHHRDKPPKQHCIATGCINWADHGSIYCSQDCIAKHANESIQLIDREKAKIRFKTKSEQKPDPRQILDKVLDRIVVMERHTGRLVTGPNAPTNKNLHLWLEKNPTFEVLRPGQQQGYISSSKFYRKEIKEELKKESHSIQPKQEASSSSGPSEVRLNVRKHLKDILIARSNDAYDIVLSHSEIKKIVIHIEEELYRFFGDCSSKYKARYRSLVFNIKDPKNKGLFRKILNNEIKPFKLVRMTSDELASKELAKWREMETKHELQKIEEIEKEVKQKNIRKMTHKGEISVFEESMADLDNPAPPKKEEKKEVVDPIASIVADTTSLHRSHLFDLNCKICTGKIAPPKEEAPPPKRLKIAKTVSMEAEEKPSDKGKDKGSSPGPSSEPSSTVRSPISEQPSSSTKMKESHASKRPRVPSLWKGFVFMPEVTKFFTTAYAISGPADFVRTDLPDSLVVCGRISPSQIWSYLKEIKQSGTRDIIVIGFNATTDEEKTAYIQFYRYLNTRERCGVIKQFTKVIKDMYIIPLSSHAPIPPVLLPFEGPGLEKIRPHMLLGVIVRQKIKRTSSEPSHQHHSRSPHAVKRHRHSDSKPAQVQHRSSSSIDSEQSYTPPFSPPRSPSIPPDAHLVEAYDPETVEVKKPPSGGNTPTPNITKKVDPIVQEYAGADPSKLEVNPGPGASPYSPSDEDEDVPYDPADPSEDTTDDPPKPSPAPSSSLSTMVNEISQGKNQAETTAAVLATLATTTDLQGKQKLLLELTKQVELQKQQLAAKQMAQQHIPDKLETSSKSSHEQTSTVQSSVTPQSAVPRVNKDIVGSGSWAHAPPSVSEESIVTDSPCFVSGLAQTSKPTPPVQSIYSEETVVKLPAGVDRQGKEIIKDSPKKTDVPKKVDPRQMPSKSEPSEKPKAKVEPKEVPNPVVAPKYQVNLPPGMLKHLTCYDSDDDDDARKPAETGDKTKPTDPAVASNRSNDALKFANLPAPIMDLLSGQKKETTEAPKEQSFASMFNRLFGTKGAGEKVPPPPLPPIATTSSERDADLLQNVMKNVKSILGSSTSAPSTDIQHPVGPPSSISKAPDVSSSADVGGKKDELDEGEIVDNPPMMGAPPPPPAWMAQVASVLKKKPPPLLQHPPSSGDKDERVRAYEPPPLPIPPVPHREEGFPFSDQGDVDFRATAHRGQPPDMDVDLRETHKDTHRDNFPPRPPPEYYNRDRRSDWDHWGRPPPPGPYRRPQGAPPPHHRGPRDRDRDIDWRRHERPRWERGRPRREHR